MSDVTVDDEDEDNGYWIKCCTCKTNFFLPDALYEAAHCSEDIKFYCPYGHRLHFPQDQKHEKNEETKPPPPRNSVFQLIKGDKK